MGEYNDVEEHGSDGGGRESGKHRSKDRSKSSSRRDEKDYKNRDHERSKEKGKESKRKDEREERDKDGVREKHKEKERDKERKDRVSDRDKERGEKSRDKDKERDRAKDKEREKHRDRERDCERDRGKDDAEREKGKERNREVEKRSDQEKGRSRDKDRSSRRHKDESQSHDEIKDKEVKDIPDSENDSQLVKNPENEPSVAAESASKVEERISRMREERLKKSSDGATEVLSWVNRSRKLEEKRNLEKEKAMQLSRIFEEQDNMNGGDSDDDVAVKHTSEHLAGVKILHGLDKVLEGGAVVLTLKDQSILADGDVNEEVDMLENVELGEQKRRDDAYKAGKKKIGVYEDKFNEEPGVAKKMLPQYDDPIADEGVTLDSGGRFTGEAEKKLEALRKRIQGTGISHGEDLNSSVRISTDYLTPEEMVKFKKPKKKKSLRKKDKLDIDALEAEAVSTGLGTTDLGSRNNGRRQNLKEEQDRIDDEKRSNAYQSALAKADEASKALRQESTRKVQAEEDDTPVFDDDDDELRKSLERVRKIALKKQNEEEMSIKILLTASTTDESTAAYSNNGSGEQQENKVVFTEMEEFVWGLQNDEETQKPDSEDVFMDEDVAPLISDQEMKDADSGWAAVKELKADAPRKEEEEEEVVPDETIHESAVGKGLGATLKLLQDRGSLKETVEYGGRNMDKKKSKLVGLSDGDGKKEIRIERTDEFGRILTPKEAFRLLSHKFHGKGPGKMKQEKRLRQYHEELKVKQMKNSDTPSLSVQRMREAQSTMQTPYLVLSGNVRTGQSSDPRSSFATVEKDLVGSLTPMLGDAKVEHFLNIKKRKPGAEDDASQKKPGAEDDASQKKPRT